MTDQSKRHIPPSAAASRAEPTACRDCTLRGAALCHALAGDTATQSRRPTIRTLPRGRLILEQGDDQRFVGVVRSGYARKSMIRLNGQRILLGLAMPGDIVGGLPGRAAPFDMEAATDIEVCMHDSAGLARQLQNGRAVLAAMLREAEELHLRTLGNLWRYGTLNSRERIIAFMVSATAFMPIESLPDGSLLLTMQIDRRDWADLTNTAVETISRTLRYLEDKALVESVTPYRFRIRDLACLATLAGVDAPAPPSAAGDQGQPRERIDESRHSERRMTAVNALARRALSLETVNTPPGVRTRGEPGGRIGHGEKVRR